MIHLDWWTLLAEVHGWTDFAERFVHPPTSGVGKGEQESTTLRPIAGLDLPAIDCRKGNPDRFLHL